MIVNILRGGLSEVLAKTKTLVFYATRSSDWSVQMMCCIAADYSLMLENRSLGQFGPKFGKRQIVQVVKHVYVQVCLFNSV